MSLMEGRFRPSVESAGYGANPLLTKDIIDVRCILAIYSIYTQFIPRTDVVRTWEREAGNGFPQRESVDHSAAVGRGAGAGYRARQALLRRQSGGGRRPPPRAGGPR